MDLKTFLDENPIITKAELARLMWPDSKNARIKLGNKLAGTQNKSGVQRVTEDDEARAKEVLKEVISKISDYTK
ncbi:hypothetical protein [Sphingobacterium multivorum]|uniref:hypothetical protein n=1 Tax=Sphingobacterium multivorum TaxID=28454 RepID=UPI0031BA037F